MPRCNRYDAIKKCFQKLVPSAQTQDLGCWEHTTLLQEPQSRHSFTAALATLTAKPARATTLRAKVLRLVEGSRPAPQQPFRGAAAYLRQEHDQLSQLLSRLVRLEGEDLHMGLVVVVLLEELSTHNKAVSCRAAQATLDTPSPISRPGPPARPRTSSV